MLHLLSGHDAIAGTGDELRNPRLSRGPGTHASVEPGQPLVLPVWLLELPASNDTPFTRSKCGRNRDLDGRSIPHVITDGFASVSLD